MFCFVLYIYTTDWTGLGWAIGWTGLGWALCQLVTYSHFVVSLLGVVSYGQCPYSSTLWSVLHQRRVWPLDQSPCGLGTRETLIFLSVSFHPPLPGVLNDIAHTNTAPSRTHTFILFIRTTSTCTRSNHFSISWRHSIRRIIVWPPIRTEFLAPSQLGAHLFQCYVSFHVLNYAG